MEDRGSKPRPGRSGKKPIRSDEGSKAVDGYIAALPDDAKRKLNEIRALGRKLVPGGTEKISYGMPSFHKGKPIFYYAGFKGHLGFYPTASGIEAFEPELSEYEHSKGAIRLPLKGPLPKSLLERIIRFKLKEAD